MNQILSTENNYKQKKQRNNNLLDMRKVIIIFSILIIIFALVIVSAKIYAMIKEKNQSTDTPIAVLNKPTITIEKAEKICILEIKYDEGLNKITYWWNNEDIIEKNMNGSTTPTVIQIAIPEGENNTLHVKATGIDGSINEVEKNFGNEAIVDSNKPVISWYHYEGTTQMDITVKSDKGVESITYNWEGEEEVTVQNTNEDDKELKITIEVKRGTNKLYIKAVDKEGNIQTKDGTIKGVIKPDFKVVLENYKTLKINVLHDKGFKKVIIRVNGQEAIFDESNPQYSEQTTDLSVVIEVPPGTLTVDISAYTLEEENREYTYTATTQIPQ